MKPIVIDVRGKDEYKRGHVAGAMNIPPEQLLEGATELEGVPKDTPLIVYCRSGSRSEVAKGILQNKGYSNITNGINKEQVEAKFHL